MAVLIGLFSIWLVFKAIKGIVRSIRTSAKATKTQRAFNQYVANAEASGIFDTDYMDGHDFEYWCAGLLRRCGFSNVRVTPGSGDQGVDILASYKGATYAIQCKRFRNNLGNTPVQEVVSGKIFYGCDRAAVMTNSFFTKGAQSLAAKTGVSLWDRNTLIEMGAKWAK